ncbi:MAG: hypothetical protein FJY85_17170 [Deltaproteobacteria bacterium]|nr:hypothetical protein [Deltaproteobacteria bacterium]
MINPDLIREIRKQFRLDWLGVHGIAHFQRVRDNGLRLAEETKAKTTVVELFAFLHDARRHNEYEDDLHGKRASKMVRHFQGVFFDLPPDDLELLAYACEFHTSGMREGDVTVLTCWDADRLDLGRVGRKPIARKLCTEPAKKPEMIEWAYRRSLSETIG